MENQQKTKPRSFCRFRKGGEASVTGSSFLFG
jgi:hypothetical protein